jgi:hypothetical protein
LLAASVTSPAAAAAAAAAAAGSTAAEFKERISELHSQLLHTERMLALTSETKDKADRARRAVVSKLMADNLMVRHPYSQALF